MKKIVITAAMCAAMIWGATESKAQDLDVLLLSQARVMLNDQLVENVDKLQKILPGAEVIPLPRKNFIEMMQGISAGVDDNSRTIRKLEAEVVSLRRQLGGEVHE